MRSTRYRDDLMRLRVGECKLLFMSIPSTIVFVVDAQLSTQMRRRVLSIL